MSRLMNCVTRFGETLCIAFMFAATLSACGAGGGTNVIVEPVHPRLPWIMDARINGGGSDTVWIDRTRVMFNASNTRLARTVRTPDTVRLVIWHTDTDRIETLEQGVYAIRTCYSWVTGYVWYFLPKKLVPENLYVWGPWGNRREYPGRNSRLIPT